MTVEATPDPVVSRWLWLFKWLLAIPHFVVLFFLYIGAFFVWIFTFFAILFTARYPRGAFDYLVGVMRWTWRVEYYTYHVAGTDRYPPFTLADVPDYPARLDIEYPGKLSRLLVLVKWWLLVIPHAIVLAILFGYTNYQYEWDLDQNGQVDTTVSWPGLVPILVFFALVVVLFTGRYQRSLYDLIVGFNRWRLRVSAYTALMTDQYPPFRLDQGPSEPDGPTMMEAARPAGPGSPEPEPGPERPDNRPPEGPRE